MAVPAEAMFNGSPIIAHHSVPRIVGYTRIRFRIPYHTITYHTVFLYCNPCLGLPDLLKLFVPPLQAEKKQNIITAATQRNSTQRDNHPDRRRFVSSFCCCCCTALELRTTFSLYHAKHTTNNMSTFLSAPALGEQQSCTFKQGWGFRKSRSFETLQRVWNNGGWLGCPQLRNWECARYAMGRGFCVYIIIPEGAAFRFFFSLSHSPRSKPFLISSSCGLYSLYFPLPPLPPSHSPFRLSTPCLVEPTSI